MKRPYETPAVTQTADAVRTTRVTGPRVHEALGLAMPEGSVGFAL